MPYIKQVEKELLEETLDELCETVLKDGSKHYDLREISGRLNYVITELLCRTLLNNQMSYFNIATAISALECCKLELYRRAAIQYEEEKIKLNGDTPSYGNNFKQNANGGFNAI